MLDQSPKSRLQSMLQAAVQSVQWTYSLFWRLCPRQEILVWSDGYYNGAIKTRKTVQPIEVSTDEATLQRSQQLRELYESLSAGQSRQRARRPSTALSPEDLTESEWFYLMCVSFSFPPGVGLPGEAYVKRQHVWLTRANKVDSKVFSRAILAKSAGIQTVACIPLLDGVVELGTTERVEEDIGLIQRVKSFFSDGHINPNPPMPALSEGSTSNPTSSGARRFQSPATLPTYATEDPAFEIGQLVGDEDEEEEDDREVESDSDAETGPVDGLRRPQITAAAGGTAHAAGGPSDLMQLDMSEDIRFGSPDDGSNHLEPDFHLLAVNRWGNSSEQGRHGDLHTAGSMHRWEPTSSSHQPPHSGNFPSSDAVVAREDTHYCQTVSAILEKQSNRWAHSSSTAISYPTSAFSSWSFPPSVHPLRLPLDGASQWVLKHILFTVPFLHTKSRDPTARRVTSEEELSTSHVLAERRRREKLKERFIVLRSLVPFVTKMDKASILGDTIEYVKQLKKRIQELESREKEAAERNSNPTERGSDGHSGRKKKKMRTLQEDGSGARASAVEPPTAEQVEVSIIERDALVEIECRHKEGLLLDVMHVLRELKMEMTTVQSSISNGVFSAELRAKVKENGTKGRKASIIEVKRSINRVILL